MRIGRAAASAFGIGLHLAVLGARSVVLEGRHQGLAVDGVAEDLLLQLFFVGEAGVVVEGVVRHRAPLRTTSAEVLLSAASLGHKHAAPERTALLPLSLRLRNMDSFQWTARRRALRLSTSSSRSCSSISWKAFLVRTLTMTGLGSEAVLSAFSMEST